MPLSASCDCCSHRRLARAPSIATQGLRVAQVGGARLPDRANRLAPAGDAEQRQKQAVNRDCARDQSQQERRPARGRACPATARHEAAPPATAGRPSPAPPRRCAAAAGAPRHRSKIRMSPRRAGSSESALLQAPSAMPAAMPLAPNNWPSTNAEHDRDRESLQRRQQRRDRIVAREKRRRQRLDQHMRGQAERKPASAPARWPRCRLR